MRLDCELSDLFFNHYHDEYHDLYRAKEGVTRLPPTREQIEQAILTSAREFAERFPSVMEYLGHNITPEDLAKDFLHRL